MKTSLRVVFSALLVACVLAASPSDYVPPTAIHTSFSNDPSKVYVMWHTTIQTPTPTVIYGTSSSTLNYTATGTSSSVILSAGFENKVTLTGLSPATKYHFECGSSNGMSQTWEFTTAPATQTDFIIAVYGDMGVTESINTVNYINDLAYSKKEINWVYHVGDIGYGDDYSADLYDVMWNMWFEYLQSTMGTVQYMVCPGNHEYSCEHSDCNSYSQNFTFYNAKFQMPGADSGSNTNMYYSFDYSNVHFVSISTETDYPGAPYNPIFGDQVAWLVKDLQKARNNPNINWIIVTGHRPLYSSYNGYSSDGKPTGQSQKIQKTFEQIFKYFHVDIYFSGHVHSYERTYPVYDSTYIESSYDNANFTTYVVAGAAGNKEGLATDYITAPDWSAHRYWKDQGFGLLQVTHKTIEWTYYHSSDGKVEDQFKITRS